MGKPKSTEHKEQHTVQLTGKAEAEVLRLARLWNCTPSEVVNRVVREELFKVARAERLGRRDV